MQNNLPATMKTSNFNVKTLFLAFAIAILGLAPGLRAQNITATIGTINSSTCAVGDTLVIPVTAVMASGISTSAISLAIDYDSTKLQCISSVTGLNSALSAGFLSNCGLFSFLSPNAPFSATTRRQFRAAWFALTPVTVNGAMFNLRFRVLATGNTSVNWDVATAGNCEFADEMADVIPNVSFVNSTITCGSSGPPPCTPPTASITPAAGVSTAATITGFSTAASSFVPSEGSATAAVLVGSGGAAPITVVSLGGGGWLPKLKRRTKKELDEERRKLGILPPEVVEEVAAAPVARRRITLQDLIGKRAAAQITNVDLSDAIAASKRRKRQKDDELLLLM